MAKQQSLETNGVAFALMAEERTESTWQTAYREDSRVLRELGLVLMDIPMARIEVRLPRRLAEAALAAWQRESDEEPFDPETFEQRVQR